MKNIVLLDAVTFGNVENLSIFEALGSVTQYDNTSPEDVLERIQGKEIIITNKVKIQEEHFKQCPSLELICIAATGTNNVDLEAAKKAGVSVRNAVDYSSDSVAQFAIGMLLELLNKTNYYNQFVQSKTYSNQQLFTHIGPGYSEIKGKTVGIIGLGNIGQKVANILEVFGANIVYYSSSGSNITDKYERLSLEELLKGSDIIMIHAPLTPKTQNLIGKKELELMKSNAVIINAGRGGIIRHDDLAEAINSEQIAGAATDVYEVEPVPASDPLLNCNFPDRLVLTPHVAWASLEARHLLLEKVAQNIKNFFAGN